jgi:hypothetical protein
MKTGNGFQWFLVAALAASLSFTVQTVAAHGSGGGTGSGAGTGSASGGGSGAGHGAGAGHGGGIGHGTGANNAIGAKPGAGAGNGIVAGSGKTGRNAVSAHGPPNETGDFRSVHNDRFFRNRPSFSSGYVNNDQAPVYDDRFWRVLTMKVQSELARRGYYHGSIDGVIGPGSRQAIRAFQESQQLPATGVTSPNVLRALKLPVPQGSLQFN